MSTNIESKNLGICRVDLLTMQDALNKILEMRHKKISGYVVTPNVDHLARLAARSTSPEIRDIYQQATLSLCDSRIIELMLNKHGVCIPEVVPGSDLTEKMFENEILTTDRVFILGGESSVIKKIRERYSETNIIHLNPSMGFIKKPVEVDEVLKRITSERPNYVFLAVGSPQQEIIANRLCKQQEFTGIAFCIGASILFLAGAEKRAPEWIQNMRLEWLYRVGQNPTRLAVRYMKNAMALPEINRHIALNLNRAENR